MSKLFGSHGAPQETVAVKEARKTAQKTTEQAARTQQGAERGRRANSRGRNFLLGMISNGLLKNTLGG